jgi:hypothetical protein
VDGNMSLNGVDDDDDDVEFHFLSENYSDNGKIE